MGTIYISISLLQFTSKHKLKFHTREYLNRTLRTNYSSIAITKPKIEVIMKRFFIFYFLLFFAFISNLLSQAWTQQASGTTKNLYGVFFINENTGWVCGESGTILKTTNGGANWMSISTGIYNRLESVWFVSSSIGVAVDQGGYIYKTTDGGNTWGTAHFSSAGLCDVTFIDQTTGFAIGGDGKILKTIDAGTTWVNVTSPNSFVLRKINFYNSSVGFIAGENHTILQTRNGGDTWNEVNCSTSLTWVDVKVTDPNTAYTLAESGTFVKTTDAGFTWNVLTWNIATSFECLYYLYPANFLASGGGIYRSTNEGSSWSQELPWGNTYIERIAFPNTSTGYAVGYGGYIYKYSTGVSNPSITVTSPNGGENVAVGSLQNITWSSSNISEVMIYYTTDNGNSWLPIISSLPAANGSHSVTVPNTPSTQCKVKVSDVNNSSIYDVSDNVFTISPAGSSGGLIAYYPFNGSANDESGNGRHGVNHGVTLTTDRFGNPGKAYQFNGTSSFIDIPGTNNLHLNSGGFTLAAWVNFTEQNSIHAIVGKHISGYGNGYYLMVRPASKIEFFVSSEYGLQTSELYNDGAWHFIVGTYDGTEMKLYVDGELKSSQTKALSNLNDSTIMIGRHHAGVASDYFNGKIDDIRIYDKAINYSEILQMFNQGINLNQGLLAYYPFNGNTNDESGNGRNGVNYGASLTADRYGMPEKAYNFNGINNYIDIPGTNNLNLNGGGFSLTSWINFTEPNYFHAIVGKHISGYGNGYYLMIRQPTKIEFYIDSEFGLQTSEPYNDGNWHFVAGVYDGATMKLYVDGILKSSQAKTYSNLNDSTLMMGKHHAGVADNYFDGKLDDIRIYGRTLTELEILSLKNENPTGLYNEVIKAPNSFLLLQNYPNPFNPSTTIKYSIPKIINNQSSIINLKIYDVLGNEIVTLVNEAKAPGVYEVELDAGKLKLSSGVYFCKLSSGHYSSTRKIILMK